MPPPERLVFDFETNAWVLADAFNVRAVGREIDLPVPTGEPAPGRWSRPETPPKGVSARVVIAIWLVAVMIVAAVAMRSLAPTLPIFNVGLFLWFGRFYEAAQTGRATSEDLRLFEDSDDPDVCLVALTIARDGETVGTDRGVAWFADGCLLYSGHRTSFALGGEDVLTQSEYGTCGVPLRVGRGTAWISLAPLRRSGDMGSKQEMRFLKALYHFRRRPPMSRIPRQWPPFDR